MRVTDLRLSFAEPPFTSLEDVGRTFVDLTYAHDALVLGSEPVYDEYHFSQSFYFERVRHAYLDPAHRLRPVHIHLDSPLFLEVEGVARALDALERVFGWARSALASRTRARKTTAAVRQEILDELPAEMRRELERRGTVNAFLSSTERLVDGERLAVVKVDRKGR